MICLWQILWEIAQVDVLVTPCLYQLKTPGWLIVPISRVSVLSWGKWCYFCKTISLWRMFTEARLSNKTILIWRFWFYNKSENGRPCQTRRRVIPCGLSLLQCQWFAFSLLLKFGVSPPLVIYQTWAYLFSNMVAYRNACGWRALQGSSCWDQPEIDNIQWRTRPNKKWMYPSSVYMKIVLRIS